MHDAHKTTRALRLAAEFLQQLRNGDASGLPADLARQLPYLLRHFPTASEIARYAQVGDRPTFAGTWLLPEDQESFSGASFKKKSSDEEDDV